MASLTLTGYEEYFKWQITGLSSAFNTTNGYVEAGITVYQFTTGGVTSISGIVSTTSAPSSGTSTSTPAVTVSPYSSGTYTFWGFTKVQDGTYWPAGSATVTVTSTPQRPWDWAWYSTIKQGGAIGLSASEWNTFCDRINEFRLYDGLSEYDFTYVYKGDAVSASIVNEARTAISAISGHGTLPSRAVSGGVVTADFFNDLKDALNDIP